jgi:hypothetical protein
MNVAIHQFGPPESKKYASGQPVYILRLDRPAEAGKTLDLDGQPSPNPDTIFIERLWRLLKYEFVYL